MAFNGSNFDQRIYGKKSRPPAVPVSGQTQGTVILKQKGPSEDNRPRSTTSKVVQQGVVGSIRNAYQQWKAKRTK